MDFLDDIDDFDALEIIIQGIPKEIYLRADHFNKFSDTEFIKRFRLTKQSVLDVLDQIEENLEYLSDTNNHISPINQILIALRVFATGGHLISVGDFAGCSVASVSRIVSRVSAAIARLSPKYIKFPNTPEELKRTQNSFYDIAKFPRVVGAIDCTHIKIQSPGGDDAEVFRNRKSYFSLNVQAICNANFEFTNVVARWPGSTHDSTIFNNSRIRAEFENNVYPNSMLLGDSGYPCKSFLMTPLHDPQTNAEKRYNLVHKTTRVKVENIFGIWKRRFPILAYGCRLKLRTTFAVIIAAAVLHNIARKNNENEPPADVDQHELQNLITNGQIPTPVVNPHQNVARIGFDVRRQFITNYFAHLN